LQARRLPPQRQGCKQNTARRYYRNSFEAAKKARLLGFMGHNYGRDNMRKRAVRRKKAERLARAKQPSREATARQGTKKAK